MGSSSGFGSTPGDVRAVHTRFRCGSACHWLNRPPRVTRRIILQKARRQPVRADLGLRLHESRRFQDLFHSPRRGAFHRSLTVLCAIGRCVYVALGGGPPRFTPDCSCPALLKNHAWCAVGDSYSAVTVCGDAFQTSSDPHSQPRVDGSPPSVVLQPRLRNACRLDTETVWAAPGSLAATTGILSVPRGTEMFQFPRCPPSLTALARRPAGCPIRRS